MRTDGVVSPSWSTRKDRRRPETTATTPKDRASSERTSRSPGNGSGPVGIVDDRRKRAVVVGHDGSRGRLVEQPGEGLSHRL